jgi:hypothetical protein
MRGERKRKRAFEMVVPAHGAFFETHGSPQRFHRRCPSHGRGRDGTLASRTHKTRVGGFFRVFKTWRGWVRINFTLYEPRKSPSTGLTETQTAGRWRRPAWSW